VLLFSLGAVPALVLGAILFITPPSVRVIVTLPKEKFLLLVEALMMVAAVSLIVWAQ
jgi:Flp pilus assembly protein TadB